MNSQAKRVSMTERVHLRLIAGLSYKGIVARHTAVITKPEHFAGMAVGILGTVVDAAGRHEEQAVAAERDT